MADLDPLIERELERLQELDLLEEGELLVEHEVAHVNGSVGSLFVTDSRVLFVSTTLVRKRTRLLSIPLRDVVHVEPTPVWGWGMKNAGTLTIKVRSDGATERSIVCRQIPGGVDRAEEVAASIIRQRDSAATLGSDD